MKLFMRKYVLSCMALVFVAFLLPCTAYANKSAVRIEAPDHAPAGGTVTILLHVTHEGNNFIHHTNWVYVKINDQEVGRWEFGAFSLPESEIFTREITYTVTAPMKISAEANCNIHGSAGIAEKSVSAP
jgi:desulfoferrodoxin (superoxide reductase-like protein)